MTNSALDGKPYAGNPHVRIDEGDGASAKPRRSSLLYMRFMTEEEKVKREKEFQAVLKGIEVVTTNESDRFYNVPGSSKYKYRRGAWKDYYKAVLDAQEIEGVDYNECRRKRCDGKKKEEIFGVHLYKLGDRETTDNIWIALACQTSNNGSDDENFALKKDTIIVKFTTNELVTRIEKDM